MLSDKVKAVLAVAGVDRERYTEALGITPQAMRNKSHRQSFSVADLVALAGCVKGDLAITLPNGQKIIIDTDDFKDKE